MTTAAPAVLGNSIVQHLRSSRAGARPGDGTLRSLLDGEIYINQADGVFCALAANGAMLTFGTLAATPASTAAETTRAETAEAIAAIGAVIVADANHAAASTDLGVIMNPLTAPRTITLPPRAQWPLNKPFPVSDESGNASGTASIIIVAAPSDTINGLASNTLLIETPYGSVAPRAGATTWIFG